MHPYQKQINRMWDFIKLRNRAVKQGYWLEVIDLTYILLEIELRLLLTSKAGKLGKPLSQDKINQQKHLMNLANLAKDNDFLSPSLWSEIQVFNTKRINAIHGLAQGVILYPKLKDVYENTTELIYNIQNLWLPIKYGPEETYEEHTKKVEELIEP